MKTSDAFGLGFSVCLAIFSWVLVGAGMAPVWLGLLSSVGVALFAISPAMYQKDKDDD